MSNYYNMRDAKVSICHELMNRGWKVYGYHADDSDLMTDYYSPAHWDGIATKNGYILVVDQRTGAEQREVKKYNYNSQSVTDRKKIEKLQEMTVERGCTEAEAETAKATIEKIMNKESEGVAEYEVIDVVPAYMANPGRCKWHIEKDGKIFDKGTGLTKFSRLPYHYDIWEEKFSSPTWADGTKKELTEEQKTLVETFKNLILRFENVATGVVMTGDGTEETEKEGLEAEAKRGYEKVIKKEKKTSLKMVEVKRNYFQTGDYITLTHHGHYWKITKETMRTETWKGEKKTKNTFTYEIVGSEKRGYQQLKNPKRYYDYEFRMLKNLEEGKIKIFELKEVAEVVEVEKWEKIDKSRNTNNNNKETETENAEVKTEVLNNKYNFTIEKKQHTKTGEDIWVCKLVETVSKEEFKSVLIDIKSKGGYYSKFVGGFVFGFDPSELLSNSNNSEEETAPEKQEESPYNQEIKDNKIYSVHFKEWSMSMGEIHEELNKIGVKFEDMGEKVGINHINSEQAKAVKELSNKNGSILFIDFEVDEMEFQEVQLKAESILDESFDIITGLKLEQLEYWKNEEYKTKLFNYLTINNYTKSDIEKCMEYYSIDYYYLVEVLRGFCKAIEQQEEQTKQLEQQQKKQEAEKTKLLEKIDSSINSLQKKIDDLSGDYKTNTWKRMKEQESRDSKINSYEIDIKLLQYVESKTIDNIVITDLERWLLVGSFRDTIHNYYVRKYGRHPQEIEFPTIQYNLPSDSWYNKEVPKNQNKLKKYNINNTIELNQAVDEYKVIYDSIKEFENPTQKKIKQLEREYKLKQKGDINFTPFEVVEQMIDLAQIDNNSRVLEPSAGIGNIADKIKKVTNNIDVCEYMNSFAELLELKGYNVVGSDFLKYDKLNYYDCIIMNPPFSAEQEHIKHAYDLLKDGGKIVAITSPSWTFNSNKKSQEFRNWFDEVGGEIIQDLKSGTFEMTGVASKIIVIDKEEGVVQRAI